MAFMKLVPETPVDPVDAATAAVRAYCGWHIAPVTTETLRLDGDGSRRLLIPSRHVVDVHTCYSGGVEIDPADLDWSQAGIIHGPPFSSRYGGVRLTLTHGWDPEEVPDVVQLIEGIAARARMSPGGNIVQQRAGTQSVSFATAGGAVASLPLMAQEKEQLAPYRLTWGP